MFSSKSPVEVSERGKWYKPHGKAPTATLGGYARALKTRLDILRNEPLPPDDELPELTEKQRSRIEAFACKGTTVGG